MAEGKYRRRVIGADPQETNAESLREQYEKEEKQELVVQRRAVTKLSRAWSIIAGVVMAVLAIVGVVSLITPELREIMVDIIAEAVREIQGF